MVKEVNGKELDEALNSCNKVLVDLWAPWCGPCRMLGPIVDKVSEEVNDVCFFKVNIDDNEDVAIKYGVESIPTLLVFENGKLANRSVGCIPERKVLDLLGK